MRAEDAKFWVQGALGEIRATLTAQGLTPDGPAGGVFTDELFSVHHGGVTVFVPCSASVQEIGRVSPTTLPEAELAVIIHRGTPDTASLSYGKLAAHVARHAIAVDGPIREHYLIDRQDSPHESDWLTEICWPVFPVVPS